VSTIVVSTTLRQKDYPRVTIIGEDVKEAISRLKESPGKDIWLFGGGILFRSLLDFGLVDTISVGVIPVLLGGGIPLLPPRSERTTLRLVSSKAYKSTGTLALEYAIEQKSERKKRRKSKV
jgi:dihydrofolate reductase